MKNITVTAQLSKEFYELVWKAAYVLHISNSEVIRRACTEFINRELGEQGVSNETK